MRWHLATLFIVRAHKLANNKFILKTKQWFVKIYFFYYQFISIYDIVYLKGLWICRQEYIWMKFSKIFVNETLLREEAKFAESGMLGSSSLLLVQFVWKFNSWITYIDIEWLFWWKNTFFGGSKFINKIIYVVFCFIFLILSY